MSETTMPAAEAEGVRLDEERSSYELAFHVLPTVAEGEVSAVFDSIKAAITKIEGEFFDEEAPERFDLAYEVIKHMEGKNRKFTSAYFGWVRFKAFSSDVASVTEAVEALPEMLRAMMIKLTKVEEENPFRFHEALASEKTVTTVEESKVIPDTTTVVKTEEVTKEKEETKEPEEKGKADDAEIEKALEEKEA